MRLQSALRHKFVCGDRAHARPLHATLRHAALAAHVRCARLSPAALQGHFGPEAHSASELCVLTKLRCPKMRVPPPNYLPRSVRDWKIVPYAILLLQWDCLVSTSILVQFATVFIILYRDWRGYFKYGIVHISATAALPAWGGRVCTLGRAWPRLVEPWRRRSPTSRSIS